MKFLEQFIDTQGVAYDLLPGKAVCVGRNYLNHIKELNNAIPAEPLLFIKSRNTFVCLQEDIYIPSTGDCHNELEIALLIGETLTKATIEEARHSVVGVGLALDLTLRDKQTELKEAGLPWERAKGFDGSCPVSPFARIDSVSELRALNFSLTVNNELRQAGCAEQMMRPWDELVCEISHHFSLFPGDIVLTGTPEGVGGLSEGDRLVAKLDGLLSCEAQVYSIKDKSGD